MGCGSSTRVYVYLPVPAHASDFPEFGLENVKKCLRILDEAYRRQAGHLKSGKSKHADVSSTVERLESVALGRAPGTPSVLVEERTEEDAASGKRVISLEEVRAATVAVGDALKEGRSTVVAIVADRRVRLACELILANQRLLRKSALRFEGRLELDDIPTCYPRLPPGRVASLVHMFGSINRSRTGEISVLELDNWLTRDIENLTYSVFLPLLMRMVPQRREGFLSLREFVAWAEIISISEDDEILRVMFFFLATLGKRTHPVEAESSIEALSAPALMPPEGGSIASRHERAPLLHWSPVAGVDPSMWPRLRRAEPYLIPTRLPGRFPEMKQAEQRPLGDINATLLQGLYKRQHDAVLGRKADSKARQTALREHMKEARELFIATGAWKPREGEELISYQEFAEMCNDSPTARFPIEYLIGSIRRRTLGESFARRRRQAVDQFRSSFEYKYSRKQQSDQSEDQVHSHHHHAPPARRFLFPFEYLHVMTRVAHALLENMNDPEYQQSQHEPPPVLHHDTVLPIAQTSAEEPYDFDEHDEEEVEEGGAAGALTSDSPMERKTTRLNLKPSHLAAVKPDKVDQLYEDDSKQ